LRCLFTLIFLLLFTAAGVAQSHRAEDLFPFPSFWFWLAAPTPAYDALHNGSVVNSLIIGDGDSIMFNTGENSNVVYSSRILNQMQASMTDAQGADLVNVSLGSSKISDMAGRAQSLDSVWGLNNAARRYRVLCLYIGVNDFVAGRTKEQVLTDYLAYIDARVAAGWQVVACTLVSNVFVTETNRSYLNSGLISNAAGHSYTVADAGSDANMGQSGQYSNTTYFRDGSHPTVTGNGVIATYYKAAINSLGLQ